jgi:hypothetical protein
VLAWPTGQQAEAAMSFLFKSARIVDMLLAAMVVVAFS